MSGNRRFVDTNILVYAHDTSAGGKHERARALLEQLWATREGCLSVQIMQEFFVTVTRKIPRPLDVALVRSAVEIGCGVIYSEDLNHGQRYDGARVENPFLLAAHARAPQGSCHVMTDRPDVSAGGPIEVFEARRVLAWHDDEMAGCDGVQVHEGHNGLVLVHHTGLGLGRHDGAEDALAAKDGRTAPRRRHGSRSTTG